MKDLTDRLQGDIDSVLSKNELEMIAVYQQLPEPEQRKLLEIGKLFKTMQETE